MAGDNASDWVEASPQERAEAAAAALGPRELAAWCADVLSGAVDLTAQDDPDPLWLAARAWTGWGDPRTWADRGMDYWPRVWAARTLLHAWHPTAERAVLDALDDAHWRVREMAAKVVASHELGAGADRCHRLAGTDDTPRVRVAALRALAVVGEAEHAELVAAARADDDEAVADAAERALSSLEQRLDRRLH